MSRKPQKEATLKTNGTSYNVCFESLTSSRRGVRTWSTFDSKKDFDSCFADHLHTKYRVVEEGISSERCLELCSTPEANSAVMAAGMRETSELLDSIIGDT